MLSTFPPLVALLSIELDPRLSFSLILIGTIVCSKSDKCDFNYFLVSSILAAFACGLLQKEVVYASIFIAFFHEFRKSSLWNLALFFFVSLLYFSLLSLINQNFSPYFIFLSLIAALTASLMESVRNERFVVLIALATALTIFRLYVPATSLEILLLAFFISFVLSLAALKAKIADETGLMSATLVGMVTIVFSDLRFFVVLLIFYFLGSAATKYKMSLKEALGIAEEAGGARGFSNVLGNSLAPLFFAMNFGVFKVEALAAAFVSSVAAALGDTMASEIGKTAKKVYLITNFKPVKAGESGGVSIIGEIAAFLGCSLIGLAAILMKITNFDAFPLVLLSSFIAVQVDSLLGATLEKKGYLNNAGVNFFATLVAGFVYLFFALFT